MTSTLLSEATSAPTQTGTGRWKAVLITPGKGSSGVYSEDVLREYGPTALRKGAKSFVTHNRTSNGEPDPFAMWGVLTGDAHYEEGVGLVGEIEVLPSWRDKVAEVAPHVALSVYVMGEADEAGNVTKLTEDVQNGVDMVVYPGRPGSSLVEQMVESARNESERAKAHGPEKTSVTSARGEKGITMEKDVAERFDALTAILNQLVTEKQTVEAEAAQAEADEKAVEERLDAYDAAVSAIESAELPADAAKALRVEARKGVDVAPLIEFAKSVKDATEKTLSESSAHGGRVVETRAVESAADLGKVFG